MDRYHQGLLERLTAIGTPEASAAADQLRRHHHGRDAFLGSSAYGAYADARRRADDVLRGHGRKAQEGV